MVQRHYLKFLIFVAVFLVATTMAFGQAIVHQITLPTSMSWCDDGMIDDLLNQVNTFRAQNNKPPLAMDTLGMKDAELRATQFALYMVSNPPGTPGFNPHTGYDTTAASLGYNIVSENLAYITTSAAYIVFAAWQDPLHIAAMLASDANVSGVSCLYYQGIAYWTYEPGISSSVSPSPSPFPSPSPSPSPSPNPTPNPTTGATPDSQDWAFLTLINNYRAQNGAGPLQVSAALENSSTWMSNDMAIHNYSGHTDSLGRSPGARLAAFGYPYVPWGENIAGGFSDAQTAFSQFENACDPDTSGTCTYAHRVTMLNPSFVVIGIGRAYNANSAYGWYWTTDFGGFLDQTISPGQPVPTQPTPSTPGAPVISFFSGNPSTITAGQSATLSWNVSGADAITLDNGIGDVSALTSEVVSPTQTTTYKLMAANAAWAVTASVTVTVNGAALSGDTQPPTVPSITSAMAKSATEVDLTWSASTDNVGVSAYQVLRNGSPLATVGGSVLSLADTTVVASTTYRYTVRAFDAAGNISNPSSPVQVTTPAAPGVTTCPGPATGVFTGCYYNNTTLSGNPILVRVDPQINFDWRFSSPGPSITPNNFSVRWQGNFNLSAGDYTFTAATSDGMRLYVDGNIILDRWSNSPGSMYTAHETVGSGTHLIVVEYYESTGTPIAEMSWQGTSSPAPQAPPLISAFSAAPPTIHAGQSATLAWNVAGATSISIDNGVGIVSGTTIAVSPSQTTSYKLTATNAGGSSVATVTITVSVSSSNPESGGGGSGSASGAFVGSYFSNITMGGNPVLVRNDTQINFDWALMPPDPPIDPRNFSVRWQGTFNFNAGTYRFTATASDGIRIYVDGNPILNRWRDEAPTMYGVSATLSAGAHSITVEFYSESGSPTAYLNWQQTQ